MTADYVLCIYLWCPVSIADCPSFCHLSDIMYSVLGLIKLLLTGAFSLKIKLTR